MEALRDAVDRRGGLIATHELHAIGCTRRRIRALVDLGAIERIRQGWYAIPGLDVSLAHAARVGGRLTCASAADRLGLWTPWQQGPSLLHVAVADNAKSLRSPTAYRQRLRDEHGVRVHWLDAASADDGGAERSRLIVPVTACIRSIADCFGPEQALVVAESALHRGRVDPIVWRRFVEGLHQPLRSVLAEAAALSESGSETVFVHRLRRLGIRVRQQVRIDGVGRVDVLIGERLIVEIDSVAHHGDQLADRRRDAALIAAGYRVIRFVYQQVMADWAAVERAVLIAVARGDHRATH